MLRLVCIFWVILSLTLYTTHANYYISPNKLKWSDANDYCQRYCDSTLASIHSIDQYQFAQQLTINTLSINTSYGSNDIWIGLSFTPNTTNQYDWVDSSTFNYGNNTNNNPWKSTQDISTNTTSCVAIDITSNYEWIDRDCNNHNRFMCNSCDGKLNKYIMINTKMNYTNGEHFCRNNINNATLASIHSYNDYQDTKYLVGYDSSWHTFIGLNDYKQQYEYEWTDGTTFDYGHKLDGRTPWRLEEPNNEINGPERCIALYQEERWWNDINCYNDGYDHDHTFLCNMPSEICYHQQWDINNNWYLDGCSMQSVGNGGILIKDQEYLNSNGVLLIQYMYTMHGVYGNGNGESGVKIYNFENECNYYYIGITSNWNGFIKRFYNGKSEILFQINLNETYYKFGVYYRLTISIVNGIEFTLSINDDQVITHFMDETTAIDPPKPYESGIIGIYNHNLNITAKSLFVSGTKIATNNTVKINNIKYCPTGAPTYEPTINPTKIPTLSPSEIPTKIPTLSPSVITTKIPTINPTKIPTIYPQIAPTSSPTISPLTNSKISATDYLKTDENVNTLIPSETAIVSEVIIAVSSTPSTPSTPSTASDDSISIDHIGANILFLVIGMVMMGLICMAMYLVCFIKKFRKRRTNIDDKVVNSIQINKINIPNHMTVPSNSSIMKLRAASPIYYSTDYESEMKYPEYSNAMMSKQRELTVSPSMYHNNNNKDNINVNIPINISNFGVSRYSSSHFVVSDDEFVKDRSNGTRFSEESYHRKPIKKLTEDDEDEELWKVPSPSVNKEDEGRNTRTTTNDLNTVKPIIEYNGSV